MDTEDLSFEFVCPKCGFVNKATLRQARQEKTVICRGCHVEIALKDDKGSVDRGLDDIEKALDEFQRSLKRLNRKFELRL